MGYVKVMGSRLLQTINVGMKSALALVLPTLQVQIKSPHFHQVLNNVAYPSTGVKITKCLAPQNWVYRFLTVTYF